MEAEIITIGTEILLGEIVDTNTRTIARRLRDIGIDIFLTTTVGDNAQRIAEAVRASAGRTDVVITTGGLGPTVDDATREGIASSMGLDLVFEQDLWHQILSRFAQFGREPTENNRRQAHIPAGGIVIENPVGTAPCFIVEAQAATVIALPGVPGEMQHLLENDVIPYLKRMLGTSEVIQTRVLRTAGLGESILDERIVDLERLKNPTVGLSAHPGRVDIRITAKAKSTQQAEEMLWGVQATLEQRLGRYVYGTDEQTLETLVLQLLSDENLTLVTYESGTGGLLTSSLDYPSDVYLLAKQEPLAEGTETLQHGLEASMQESGASVGVGLNLVQNDKLGSSLEIMIQLPSGVEKMDETYPSVFVNMEARAVSIALNLLRLALLKD